MNRIITLIAAPALAVLTGCASVEFYELDKQKNKMVRTGLPFYESKPHLLVIRNPAEDKPIEAKLVYLKDESKPKFAFHRPGWGKQNFTVKLDNGILTEFGSEFDSQGAETLGAAAGLITAGGGAFKAVREAKNLVDQSGAPIVPPALITSMEAVRDDFRKQVLNSDFGKSRIESTRRAEQSLSDAVITASSAPDEKTVQKLAKELETTTTNQIKALEIKGEVGEPDKTKVATFNADLQSTIGSLATIVEALKKVKEPGAAAPPPKLEVALFEIRTVNGTTELIPVKFDF